MLPTCIYYIPIDTRGKPTGQPVKISLRPDGVADLSGLPEKLRSSLTKFGIPDSFGIQHLKPEHGGAFLNRLLQHSNGYMRFTEKSESST